jgi:hypothetical protein
LEDFMRVRSLLLAVALFAATIPALATPQPIDATDLWISPDESGWGLNLFHQGDTLFGSLFVYGPDGQPKWYTASALTGGPFVFSGALTEATGPWFGGPFDPNRVNRRTVGSMSVSLGESDATINYTVDGVQVSKRVNRFSMRPLNIGAAYYGVMLQPARGGSAEISRPDQHIVIQDDGSTVTMYTDSNTTSSCSFAGTTRAQNGEMVTAGGTAGTPGGASRCGDSWRMTIDPTPNGFTGNFSGFGITDGRISASRRAAPVMGGSGWVNDLWFPTDEAGWGVNLIEQGDSIFATLFVYDAQGRPHWYSASQLVRDGAYYGANWNGALYESTGPYFGTSFNAAAVTRRQVGTMGFTITDSGGYVRYTVDGISVERNLKRFAFRKNELTGSYKGMLVMRQDDPRGQSYDDAEMTIDDSGGQFVMDMNILTGPRCTYTGTAFQNGSLRSVAGSYACGSRYGAFEMKDIAVTANGFTATYQGPAGHIGGLITNGYLSGVRR